MFAIQIDYQNNFYLFHLLESQQHQYPSHQQIGLILHPVTHSVLHWLTGHRFVVLFLTLQLNLYVSSKENVVEDAKKVLANLSNEEDKQGAEIDLAAAETSLARIKKAIKKLSK